MTRSRIAAVLVLVLVGGLGACGRYLEAGAAVVDGQEITKSDLEERVASVQRGQGGQQGPAEQVTRQVLLQLIQDVLISREADRRGLSIAEADVSAQLTSIRDRFPSEQEFQSALAAQGLDTASLRERVRNQIVIERIQTDLAKNIEVSEADIKQAYGTGAAFEEVTASHILFAVQPGGDASAALKKARDTLARIRAGADFAAEARRVSEDPGTKTQGGSLGQPLRRDSQIVREFLDAAFALKAGQVSEPVRTQFGYHLIKVTSHKKPTLAQVRDQIRSDLLERRGQESFQDFLGDLIKRAKIVVNPRYGDFDAATLNIIDHQFFVPASPEPVPGGIPGLELPQPQS